MWECQAVLTTKQPSFQKRWQFIFTSKNFCVETKSSIMEIPCTLFCCIIETVNYRDFDLKTGRTCRSENEH